jgi:hypothetical protein
VGRHYALDPAMPVLLRPDGAVQVGWNPRRAVLVHPPDGVTSAALAAVLRGMQVPTDVSGLHRLAAAHGIPEPAALDDLLEALVAARVMHHRNRSATPHALSIRVHGCGPLSDLLLDALRCSGARVAQSSHANAVVSTAGVDMVVRCGCVTAPDWSARW